MSMLDNNNIEVGIQTAQLLMDRKRHDNLKKKMKKQFPLVPDVVLDSTIDMVAQTFTKVAPEKLKLALQPGGMDQVRPEMEFIIVQYTLKHPLFEGIPIFNNVDKRRLVEAIVSRALDYVLQDARQVLAAPEVRLETLEEQLTEIKALMGPKRLFMYRVRHNYKRIAIFAAIALVSTAIYQQRNVPAVVQLLALPSTISNQFTAITTWASAKFSIICYTVRSKLSALSTATKKLVAR